MPPACSHGAVVNNASQCKHFSRFKAEIETIFLEWDNSEDNKDQQQQFSADNNVDITGETIIDF